MKENTVCIAEMNTNEIERQYSITCVQSHILSSKVKSKKKKKQKQRNQIKQDYVVMQYQLIE